MPPRLGVLLLSLLLLVLFGFLIDYKPSSGCLDED